MRIVKEHDERKTEIIDNAERFFLSKGYEKTTVNDILKSVGIAKGTFYHYFKSKEEVMDAVIMRVVEQDMLIAKDILKNNELNPLEKILQFLSTQSSDNKNEQKSEILEQFHHAENALMKQRALEASIQYVCPILAEMIEEGNKQQLFNAKYSLETIQFLVAGIQSLMSEKINSSVEAIENRVRSFATIIFRVLEINRERFTEQEILEKFQVILSN